MGRLTYLQGSRIPFDVHTSKQRRDRTLLPALDAVRAWRFGRAPHERMLCWQSSLPYFVPLGATAK